MQAIVKLFQRSQTIVDERRLELLDEMHDALMGFKQALQKYEQNTDQPVAYSQMLFAEVEMYRDRYYTARLQYEQTYGDPLRYKEKLDELQQWMKERNLPWMFKHPNELYASAKQIS